MEGLGLVQQAEIQLLERNAGVGTGLPGKGKLPVAGLVQRHEGQSGKHIVANHHAPGLDADFIQRSQQHFAESVVAHFAHQGSFHAEFCHCGQEIGHGAAGMGRHGGVAVAVHTLAGEINQQLAKGYHVDHTVSSFGSSAFRSGGCSAM